MVEITQADREAAEDAYHTCYEDVPNSAWMDALIAGKHDDDPLVRAFARHRINALRSLADDQAMVEQAARAMCREGGFDPNEIMPNDGQRWRYYVPAVQAALRAIGEPGLVELDRVTKYAQHGREG